jgi:methionyl-tRNA formyltransferase
MPSRGSFLLSVVAALVYDNPASQLPARLHAVSEQRGGQIASSNAITHVLPSEPSQMNCIVLTPFPWVASRLDRVLDSLGGRVCAVIAPPSSALFDWSECAVANRLRRVETRYEMDDIVASTAPDVLLAWGYPWRVPAATLGIPCLGAVNLHPGQLPKLRGPMPIAWALRNGETQIGVTWHRMVVLFDAGPILAQSCFSVDDQDDIFAIGQKVDAVAERLLPEVLAKLCSGEAGADQSHDLATTAPLFRDDSYACVDWSWTARAVHNQVRAWSCAGVGESLEAPRAVVDGALLVLERTSLVPVEGCRAVQTGDGLLWIVRSRRSTRHASR